MYKLEDQVKYRYGIEYRRDDAPTSRTFRQTVIAQDADEARRVAAQADPRFLATVRSPRRGPVVTA